MILQVGHQYIHWEDFSTALGPRTFMDLLDQETLMIDIYIYVMIVQEKQWT